MIGVDCSVIIPCFNDGAFVAEAVYSALVSARKIGIQVEVLVIDDGSTDGETKKVLATLPGDVIVINQPNCGAAQARAFGAKRCSAEWIIFLDADNLLTPGYFNLLHDPLFADPSVAVIFGDYQLFGDRQINYVKQEINFARFLQINCVDNCVMMRRSVLESIKFGIVSRSNLHEDWLLWLHLIVRGYKFIHFPGIAFKYRSRPNSKSTKAHPARRAEFERESLDVRIDLINKFIYKDRKLKALLLARVGWYQVSYGSLWFGISCALRSLYTWPFVLLAYRVLCSTFVKRVVVFKWRKMLLRA